MTEEKVLGIGWALVDKKTHELLILDDIIKQPAVFLEKPYKNLGFRYQKPVPIKIVEIEK